MLSTSASRSSIRGFEDTSSVSSSPIAPMPRGDLFRLGLTPVQSIRSVQSVISHATAGGPLFAPALPATQRVSMVNVARRTAGVDIMDVVDMAADSGANDPGQTTPTPPSRTTSIQWLPTLSMERGAGRNPSTTAVFEGSNIVDRRRTSFMSKLVGSAWGLAGIGFTSMHGHRRTQSTAITSQAAVPALASLPSIPIGKGSIEQAVFGPNITTSRISAASSGGHSLANKLAPANSTLRMTGSKSGRALDDLDDEMSPCGGPVDVQVKLEERPRKKRRSSTNEVSINADGLAAFDQVSFLELCPFVRP
jgi:hypothetical protein